MRRATMAGTHARFASVLLTLSLVACGGSGGSGGGDDSTGSSNAAHAVSISQTFNLDAREPALFAPQTESFSNGDGIGQIQPGVTNGTQPGNGYTITSIDVTNSVSSDIARSIHFATKNLDENATAAQLAAYLNQQSNQLHASADTKIRLALSHNTLTFDNFFSLNGTTITGDSIDAITSAIDRIPNITATVNSANEILVTATNGDDLRLDLSHADNNNTGLTATITSYTTHYDTIDYDTITLGDNQRYALATVGGNLWIIENYPFLLANAGAGNVFGSTLLHTTYRASNPFDAANPSTYNHAYAIEIDDSLGNSHVMTQYFVKQDSAGGTDPNRWSLYLIIDGHNVGAPDSDGNPTTASFDIVFDTNGQLDTTQNNSIKISAWIPLDENSNPNGAATTRITIDITGSTLFAGEFSVYNVAIH